MNREDKLLELYRKGLTSSKEEDALLNQLGESKSGPGLWFSFLKNNKKTAPADLENKIWSAPWQQKGMSYEEKAAVLEEAILMMSGTTEIPDTREILYEDEIICIYIE